jgi:signal transduction histidine kinase/ActR/RegA family two-component response regulator
MIDKNLDPEEKNQLYFKQVNQLYERGPVGVIATVVNSAILCAIQWSVISHSIIVTWFSVLFLITLIRAIYIYKYCRASSVSIRYRTWGTWFIIGIGISGVIWGSAGIFLVPGKNIAHQIFPAFVLGGMVAGAASAFSALKMAFFAYALPVSVPIIVRFFSFGDKVHITMAVMGLLYIFLVTVTAIRSHKVLVKSLELGFENKNLVNFLSAAKEKTERINEKLEAEIIERKKVEEELKKHQVQLEAQLQLARKMESIGTLAGGIAHDFNNLLMAIQGNVTLMLGNLDPGHHDYKKLKLIEQCVQSGASLTKQLLGFARGGKYEVKPTNLNEIIKNTSNMFGRTKKEIKISIKFQEDLWAAEVDGGQIEQVLLNLYINAWQAMPGGGDLHIETENITLSQKNAKLHDVKPGRYVKISVSDTGIGMDDEIQLKIFDPFFTTKEMGRGTGLGLASAYGIIKNHGGVITIESEKGKGTSFHIYLPASKKKAEDAKKVTTEFISGTGTILVVDDEEFMIDICKQILERMGFKVLIAKSGKEAIQVFSANRDIIDLVILDIILPGMDGGVIYDCLKDINPGIKVLIASGYSIEGKASELMKKGCKGFIQKPFRMNELSLKLNEILSNK